MKILLLVLTVLLAQRGVRPGTVSQAGQPAAGAAVSGTIKGIVKPPDSPDGIPDVEITLIGAATPGAPGSQMTAATDSKGEFSFSNLAVGRYTLRAQKNGYFGANPDPAAPPAIQAQTMVPVTISAGTPDVQVSIPMVPGGTISGRVLDGQGRPAVGMPMLVLRTGYQDGRKTLVSAAAGFTPIGAGATVTNDRGEYRLFWYAPGEYFVKTDTARPQNRVVTGPTTPVPTFYPGTREASRAIPITIRAGQEVAGIDFTMETAPALKVSGKIKVSVPGGQTMPDGQVYRSVSSFFVVEQNAEISDRIPLTNNSVAPAGSNQADFDFELRGIAPGRYYLYPLFSAGQAANAPAGLANYYSTRIPVEVIDKDVTGLVGEIHRFPDVTFRLALKGEPPPIAPQQPLVPRLQLRIQEAMGNLISGGAATTPAVGPDGTVVFPNLFPSKYRILLLNVPLAYYVADIRQGATSLYNDGSVTVTGDTPSSPVEITLSTGGGQIRGVVKNKKGEPAAARIVLIPQSPRRANSLLYKRATAPAATGQFTLAGIAPGEYKIFAWENSPNGAEENAEFLDRYETRGKVVTVSAGATISDLQIDLISDEASR